MEGNTEHTLEKKSKPLIPILIFVLILGGILWFWSEKNPKLTQVSEQEENHSADDGHGHAEEGHEGHAEEEGIKLSDAEMKEFGIQVAKADAGKLYRYVDLPGEIRPNGDRLAHLVPRVPGVVRQVFKSLGDRVEKGEVMAILESRELSDLKADFLAALERVSLARTNFEREESLWLNKISSEQEYLEAKRTLAEAQIERGSAEQKLHSLGFSNRYLENLPSHPEESFTRYEIISPFKGRVIEKHITLGEVLKDDVEAFVIADLSSVWVDLSVYKKDFPYIEEEQLVIIETTQGAIKTTGKINYLGPVVNEMTRTALARIVLENKQGKWRPGLFVNAKVAVGEIESDLIVSKSAIQKINDEDILFVMADGEFKPRPVKVGRSDESYVEIVEGIYWGDTYVAEGAFTLRAQMGVGDLDDGHNH